MGVFVHHPDDYILINGERFTMEVFLAVEPKYSLPVGATGRTYVQGERNILTNGKTSWEGVFPWPQGDIYINRLNDFILMRLTDEQDTLNAEAVAREARFGELTPAEKRKQKSPPFSEMLEALWRHVVEGEDLDISGCRALQSIRESVHKQYPDA